MGWLSRLKNPALKSLRVFRVSGFEKILILYRPVRNGVDILRVVHGSRNLPALLRREGLE
jgi:toxin ParE1/3/4